MRPVALVGLALVVAHGAGFAWLAERARGRELVVDLARVEDWGVGPGLVRKRWSATYRGGHVREVGASQLVGPLQDPARPACSGRVVIGQRLLDDGAAGPGTIAAVTRQELDEELRGMNVFPVGDYRRIKSLALEWAQLESNPGDRRWLGAAGAPNGYVRATANIAFARVDVPVTVALIPERRGEGMAFRIAAAANLAFDNRVLQWVSDRFGADKLATAVVRQEIDKVLVTTFAPPPPFALSHGQTLRFMYCDVPVDIADGEYGALPFAIAIEPVAGAPHILPPRFGRGARPAPRPTTSLSIDLDVDALNAMLYELWRTGWLDDRLDEVGLDRRFNEDPTVIEYLSIRLSPVRLALPPVVHAGGLGALRMGADARVAIGDGADATIGRVWGALDFRFPAPAAARAGLPVAVELGELELACERTPTVLVPCYGELVTAIRGRGTEFHGELTEAFAGLLSEIFVARRIDAPGLPADLIVESVAPSLAGAGTLHLELGAKLVPTR